MAEMTGSKRRLSFGEMMKVKGLRRKLECTPDGPEYDRVKALIAEIIQGPAEEPPKTESDGEQATGQKSGKETSSDESVNIDDIPYMSYLFNAEIMTMVKTPEGSWMSYPAICKRFGKTVFDLNPNDITVMYIDHDKYQELLESDDAQFEQVNVLKHCARRLPENAASVEISIINWILFAEAERDDRIVNLGCYELGSTESCETSGLYDDFYSGVIYNVLHEGMTLEAAREFAETGKKPEPTEEEQPPKPEQGPPKEESRPKPAPNLQPKPSPSRPDRKRKRFM